MKKLITIILALIMTLFTAPQKGAVRPPVTAEITPQTAITISMEQVPDVSETTAKTAFVSEVEEPETQAKIKETTVIESEDVSKETDIFTKEKMPTVQEAMPEKYTEVTEGTITEPKEDTVECIDEGDQNLAEYKPQIGDQPNPFENDTPTKIDNRPVTGFNEEMPYRWTPDTVSGILEREDYIGNTVNCRYTRLSYKDKRRIERPESEHMRVEPSHEAIIDDETWRLVQKLRANKRRPKKTDGLDKYSGLLFCEDCGSKMYFVRERTRSSSSKSQCKKAPHRLERSWRYSKLSITR